jgi:hypothetical protein
MVLGIIIIIIIDIMKQTQSVQVKYAPTIIKCVYFTT